MNDIVALDLKEYKKGDTYFLHMIDLATRFSRSCITRSKDPKEIVECIITTWLGSGLGAPRQFLCDNGGEFANDTFLDLCENMNIQVKHTAGYSPFSNGLCEKNHAVIDDMVYKMKSEQPELPLNIALAWAVNAKNCLQSVGGFSPHQLVYGRNPNLPNSMNDELPALEGKTSSEVIARHLNACHSARRAFIAAEASEKVRRALKAGVKQTRKEFNHGEKVYFKRPDRKEWSGPATVIGKDGKIVILKYGAYIVRAHEIHVQDAPYNFEEDREEGRKKLLETLKEYRDTEKNRQEGKTSGIPRNDSVTSGRKINVEDELTIQIETSEDNDLQIETSEDNDLQEVNQQRDITSAVSVRGIPRIGQNVKYLLKDSTDWIFGKIHSRAGKATGQYKDWRNVEHKDGTIVPMDWKTDVEKWQAVDVENGNNDMEDVSQQLDIESLNEALMASDNIIGKEVEKAKVRELESWKNFNVYREVKNEGQKAISVRWVITEKDSPEGKKVKARLVARGFEEKEDIKSDSPTVSKEVLRTFVALCSSLNWRVNSIDIKAAFLQSEGIEREVYLIPPAEANCDRTILWKLERCVYGLNDAARKWYLTVRAFLLKMNCVQLITDPAAFYWYHNGKLSGIFLMHVDDFLWGGNARFETNIVSKLRNHFKVRDQNCNIFKYIGMNIQQGDSEIIIHQNEFCKSLQPIEIVKGRRMDREMLCNDVEKEQFRSLVGQLGWLCTNSRPDLSYDVLELSCKVNKPKIGDMFDANKCLRKACMFQCSMHFPKLKDVNNCKLVVFSDASHSNLPDGVSSAGGFVIFLVDGQSNACPLYWESRKIRRVVKSTLAAETLAAADAIDSAYYIGHILSQILSDGKSKIPIELFVDNKSLFDNVYSVKSVSEKRLRIDIASIKELVATEKLKVKWVETGDQVADVLTKRGVNPMKICNILESGFIELP